MTDTPLYRVSQAARFLGVSTDTVRRWITSGILTEHTDSAGRTVVAGTELAHHANSTAALPPDPRQSATTATNRFVGLITRIQRGDVISIVEVQAGAHRIHSTVPTDSLDNLHLTPGVAVIASALPTAFAVERL